MESLHFPETNKGRAISPCGIVKLGVLNIPNPSKKLLWFSKPTFCVMSATPTLEEYAIISSKLIMSLLRCSSFTENVDVTGIKCGRRSCCFGVKPYSSPSAVVNILNTEPKLNTVENGTLM